MNSARSAVFGALIASFGDFLLLYVANTARGGAGSILIGALLGIAGIPLYALGYGAAGRVIREAAPRASRAVTFMGGLGAMAGAVIHALTGVLIHRGSREGTLGGDPLAAVAESGILLPALWGVAAMAVLVASLAFAVAARPVRPLAAVLNPAAGTLLVAAVGYFAGPLRDYIIPAAPNLAHLLFFALLAVPRDRRVARDTS